MEIKRDSSIIDNILSNNRQDRSKALGQIYEQCFPRVKKYVSKNHGDLEAAKDLFQETITIVYHNLSKNRFRGESPLNYYVIGIAKKLWLSKLRKKEILTTQIEGIESVFTEEMSDQVDISLLSNLLAELSFSCRVILKNFYYDSWSMEKIAEDQNLGSAQAAKTKKLRCMKKLSALARKYRLEKHHFIL